MKASSFRDNKPHGEIVKRSFYWRKNICTWIRKKNWSKHNC